LIRHISTTNIYWRIQATCFGLFTGHHQASIGISIRCCLDIGIPIFLQLWTYIKTEACLVNLLFSSLEHFVMSSLKLAACQPKNIYLYKNLRAKVQSCCSNIYFYRQCLKQGLILKYAQIKVPYTSPASIITHKKNIICFTFYPISVFVYVHNCKIIGIPIPKQHLRLIPMEAWWWPVSRSKHVAYILQ